MFLFFTTNYLSRGVNQRISGNKIILKYVPFLNNMTIHYIDAGFFANYLNFILELEFKIS